MENPKMRADIQEVFVKTPHHKQVMMFSATMPEDLKKGKNTNLSKTVRNFCKTKPISLLMKENWFYMDSPNSLFTFKKYRPFNSEQKVLKTDPFAGYLGLQSNDHLCEQSRQSKEADRAP